MLRELGLSVKGLWIRAPAAYLSRTLQKTDVRVKIRILKPTSVSLYTIEGNDGLQEVYRYVKWL